MIKQNYLSQDFLSEEEINLIHRNSVEIFEETGVEVHNEKAREVFSDNGARVEDEKVYLSEELIEEYLDEVPSSFTLHARNPKNDVTIGEDSAVLAPGYGAPWVADMEGNNRDATYEDYREFESFRRELDSLAGVKAFEISPPERRDTELLTKQVAGTESE